MADDESTYDLWSPYRALDMFEFLAKPMGTVGPKVVFAHLSKLKPTAISDRHENCVMGAMSTDEYSDDSDPSSPDAYTGQLIYINSLVLQLVDDILREVDHDPILVIAGDHNRRGGDRPLHPILAAFHLPDDSTQGPHESISSVNHFTYILSSYFEMDIGLIDDRTISHSGVHWDFTTSAEGRGT